MNWIEFMIKAILSNDSIVHRGNFGINVVIDRPIQDLSISDFVFTAVAGNGVTNIEFPESLDIVHVGKSRQMLFIIPVELPENVSGEFRVGMRDRLYTVDNTEYDSSSNAIGLSDTEQQSLACEEKVFAYNT